METFTRAARYVPSVDQTNIVAAAIDRTWGRSAQPTPSISARAKLLRDPQSGDLRVELTTHSTFRASAIQRVEATRTVRENLDSVAKQFVSTVNAELRESDSGAKLKLVGDPADSLVLAGHAADSTFLIRRTYTLSVGGRGA